MTLRHLYKVDILYCDISIINIMCTLKKGENIILKTNVDINTKSPTLLVVKKNKVHETFLNDYDLTTYVSNVFGITILISI